ncbi:MAG: hypothetical protein HZA95_00725 [Candidatus Vogelbacteria bacterium]|nr:hypothetical protein [Candidatus Vogelbacteria bacterium]
MIRERTSKLMADEQFAVVIDVFWSKGDEHRYKLCEESGVYYVIPYVKLKGERKFKKFSKSSWVQVDESLVDDIKANPQLVAFRRNFESPAYQDKASSWKLPCTTPIVHN